VLERSLSEEVCLMEADDPKNVMSEIPPLFEASRPPGTSRCPPRPAKLICLTTSLCRECLGDSLAVLDLLEKLDFLRVHHIYF
jgi:hypothetical protein